MTDLCLSRFCSPAFVCAADRYLDKTARSRTSQFNIIDYMCRFDQKYAELSGSYDRFDGNPFT